MTLTNLEKCPFPYFGGSRHAAVAARLKAEGVKAGVPDLFLAVARGRWHGLYIELKRPGGRVSPAQSWWHERLREQGYAVVVAYGADATLMQRIAKSPVASVAWVCALYRSRV